MGFFKKIGKAVKKAVKQVGSVVKKVAPIALALTGVGGVVGGVATKVLTGGSKLKSLGTNVTRAATGNIVPLGQAIQIKKALTTTKAAPAAKKSTAKAAPKPKAAKKAPAPKYATLTAQKPLWSIWEASDKNITWEEYADQEING